MKPHDEKYDVCIVGSGAGAGPVAYTFAMKGKSVVILEKGGWFTEKEFAKDEIGTCRRELYTSHLNEEPHVIEFKGSRGQWIAEPNTSSGWSFWNGNIVGGSSNFMSGFFHRMKEIDFRLKSEFGPIEGAHVEDWPIDYNELEPWYTLVEEIVGISGKVIHHKFQEKRSTPDFPFDPLVDHPISLMIDEACQKLGMSSVPLPRAIITRPFNGRNPCSYSVYCGSYGCNTGAKGSARASLINPAVKTGNCYVITHAMAYKLETDNKGNIQYVRYFDKEGKSRKIYARLFVVACQAIESARLLLLSTSSKFPDGIGNQNGLVGKNLLFSGGGIGYGDLLLDHFSENQKNRLMVRGPFINRSLHDFYVLEDTKLGRIKGGIIDFLHEHPNPIRKANKLKYDGGRLIWGRKFQKKLEYDFKHIKRIQFEIFNDWLPNDNCFVALSTRVRDKWGLPVARIRIGNHPHDLKVASLLASKAEMVLKEIGATNIRSSISGSPPANLQAGGLRFGHSPKTAVLDKYCKVFGTGNLFVTDGSFMPTGGSVPYTWTIYANAFRVANYMLDLV